ncbi:MAG: nucleotidyl transferase AbiEii/AbiGii toxin family protein [Acidimicrobiia bacterium]|nr:nucleotidyl transferase AbiEii/AbiGii toxin family protein [Acidimicrobiia bacterium]
MTLSRSREPGNLSHLQRWLTEWSDTEGVTAGRLQRRVGVLVVSAMLDHLRDDGGYHRFVAKGGAALEMRFGVRARTSKDFDTVYRGALDDVVAEVEAAVERDWHGFTGRVVRVDRVDVPGLAMKPVRFEVKLTYKGRAFGTVPMEVAAPEGQALARVDAVEVSLDPVGLPAPPTVSCLSVRYQVAQKLHACTDPLDGERLNDRAYDLADLTLLEELLDDDELAEVRTACLDVFGVRNKHPWPPALVAPAHWPALWQAVVEEDDFPITFDAALERVRALIARIDAAG